MKKFIYNFGVVIINIFVFGALFKVQHWTGAGILIVLGLGLFCLVFLPLAFYHSYKGNGGKYKSLYIAGFICAFITFIGAMFKIQHWQGAGWFLLVGIPLPFIYFLPVYIYHHNKSKEKSMVNFLGVMFMMVYVALFTSILALNISRNILDAFVTSDNDITKTNNILSIRNQQLFESINKGDISDNKEIIFQLKTKSDEVYTQINNIKVELIKAIENSDSKAIEAGNKTNTTAIMAIDETVKTTTIMRGKDWVSGEAIALKKQIKDYRDFLKSLTTNNSESVKVIDELLNTSDIADSLYGEARTIKWEDDFFPYNTYMICILGNLDCIATNVKMAEGEVLEGLAEK